MRLPRLLKVRNPYYWIVIFLRLVFALYIFINPFWGWAVSALMDVIDGQVLPRAAKLSSIQYHLLDKILDTFGFFCMLLVSYNYGIFWLMLFLFVYRLVGQILFWKTQNERFLLFFPNIFEVFWLWCVGFYSMSLPRDLAFLTNYEGLVILLMAKLIQEFVIHDFGKATVFPWFRRRFSFVVSILDSVFSN